jgi:hypothetical protein
MPFYGLIKFVVSQTLFFGFILLVLVNSTYVMNNMITISNRFIIL